MSFKPIDPKRDEIRRYLERGCVLDSLTKIFIRLIKERPEDPMEYIRNNIGVVRHQHDKYERLSQDLHDANLEIERLRTIINSMNPDVLQGQSPQVVESDDSDTGTVAEKVDSVKTEYTPETNQKDTAADNIAVVQSTDKELANAIENCQIEDNNVVDGKIDLTSQSLSVQAESKNSTNNTE